MGTKIRAYVQNCIGRYAGHEGGATAIEYGLIAALISLAVSFAIFAFGDSLNELFFSRLTGMFG